MSGRPFNIEQRPNGHEVVVHPGSVAIIPVLSKQTVPFHEDNLILLISQHRSGPDKVLIEIPAGTCEPGESPVDTAVRELKEECGFVTSYIQPLGSMYPSPGYCSEVIRMYVAGGALDASLSAEFHPIEMQVGYVLHEISDGIITDGKTIAALMLWQLLSDGLLEKTKWFS